MKSFMPMPQQMTLWRCPECGREETIQERTFPYIYTLIPWSFRKIKPPVCPKCKKKMIKVKLFY
jgi:predicted RNA-binding Zn-ribbon protein involved in translation (DUF1610 family)